MKKQYYILIDTQDTDVVKRLGPVATLAEAYGIKQKNPGSLLVKEVKTKIVEEL